MKNIVIYVHGKGGSAEEAEHYRKLFTESEVIGFDYRATAPWEAKEEFRQFFTQQRKRCDISRWWQTASARFSLCPHWMKH